MATKNIDALPQLTGTPVADDVVYVRKATGTPADGRAKMSWLANFFCTLLTTQTLTNKQISTGSSLGHAGTPLPVFPGQVTWQGGAVTSHVRTATATITTTSMAADTTYTQNVTVTGAAVNDMVEIGVIGAAAPDEFMIRAAVTAADTVEVKITNISTAGATPNFNVRLMVWRFV